MQLLTGYLNVEKKLSHENKILFKVYFPVRAY